MVVISAGRGGKTIAVLGWLLVALGALVNKWSIEAVLATDGSIDSFVVNAAIALFQVTLVLVGIYLVRRRPRVPPKVAWISVLGAGAFLGAVELGARVWLNEIAGEEELEALSWPTDFAPDELAYSPHHYLNYVPTPGYRKGERFHNSLGFRDDEFTVEKPDGVYRIVALGGSTMYTARVPDNRKTFTTLLGETLRTEYGHEEVQVINAGAVGYSSWESVANLCFRVLDLEPDLLIVYHGTNDVHTRLVDPDSYRGDNSGRRRPWSEPEIPALVEHSVALRIACRKLKLDFFPFVGLGSFVNPPSYHGPATIPGVPETANGLWSELLDANPPTYFRRNLVSMIGIARAHDVEIMLATWAHSPYFEDYAATETYQRAFRETNDVVAEVAAEHGTLFLDFVPVMSQEREFWADGRHVNEKGARLKAELFAEYIDAQLDFEALTGPATVSAATRSLEERVEDAH